MATNKPKARAALQKRLNLISDYEYDSLSLVAYRNLKTLLDTLPVTVQSFLIYKANRKWLEISIKELATDYPARAFDHVELSRSATFPNRSYDAILVPIYGFNDTGHRLGHGGGWYDRLLSNQPNSLKVGVGLEVGQISFRPEPHDIVMDVIVTEVQIRNFTTRL